VGDRSSDRFGSESAARRQLCRSVAGQCRRSHKEKKARGAPRL